jgi:ATP/maltotriose-dependent transcriptional regulator MalT/DNA-binding MarR family transcriptional regulator
MGIEQVKVEDRIMLHLHGYIRFADDFEVPKAMAQRGIGEAIWIAWSNVPRAMKRLVAGGLVEERTSRVKGEFRKKKIYVLTPQGFARAKELKEDLGTRRVKLMKGGNANEMAFADVPEVAGPKVPYLELLRGIGEDGTIDLEKAAARWAKKVEMVDRTEHMPKPRTFFGREKELATLKAMLAENRIVVLHGIAGIGKTSLVVRLVDDLRKETNVTWVNLHSWDTMPGVLGEIASFLADADRRATHDLLTERPAIILNDVQDPLETDLKDLKGVIIFDDFHKVPPPVVELFKLLLEVLDGRPSPTLLLVSRYQPNFYDRRHVTVQNVVGELLLKGMDKASARKLLEGRGMSDADFERFYSMMEGNPLELLLLRDPRRTAPLKDVKTFVREQMFEGLTDGERSLLAAICVHRSVVPREAALAAATRGGGASVLDRLLETGLVQETREGMVDLHDMVREFVYDRLTSEERISYHRDAAVVWARRRGPDAVVEHAYHLAKAEGAGGAVEALSRVDGKLLSGSFRDVLAIVDEAKATGALSKDELTMAELLRGDALAGLDLADDAVAIYTRLLDAAIGAGDRAEEGRILARFGRLHARRGQHEQAIEAYGRARRALEAAGDASEAAKCRLGIADVQISLERKGEAMRELQGALKTFREAEDGHGIATACIKLGDMRIDSESPKEARTFLKEAMRNLDPREEAGEVALANYLMGESYRLEERWGDAVGYYERALELFTKTGDGKMGANACDYLSYAYKAMGDPERADLFYQRGMDLMVAQ